MEHFLAIFNAYTYSEQVVLKPLISQLLFHEELPAEHVLGCTYTPCWLETNLIIHTTLIICDSKTTSN